MAKDKPIVVRQRTKGQKIAKALVATFTPLICVGGVGAGVYYAFLRISDKDANLSPTEDRGYEVMTWSGKVRMHQELQIRIKINKGDTTDQKWNKIELLDGDQIVPIYTLDEYYSIKWHITPEGILVANTSADYITYKSTEDKDLGISIHSSRSSKKGQFTVRMSYDETINEGGN